MATILTLINGIVNNLNTKVVAGTATSDEIVLQSKAIDQLYPLQSLLDATSVSMTGNDIDFSQGQVFTKTLTGNTTITFSNYSVGQVKDFIVTGNFTITFSTGTVNITAGIYDGSVSNLIQILCSDSSATPIFWISISKNQS